MKLVIIIVVALVLGAATAAGVFFLMGGELPKSEPLTRLPPPAESVVEHWPVDMGTIPFPSYRGGRVTGFVFVRFTLTLRGDYDAKFLDLHMPILKDTIIRKYVKEGTPMTTNSLQVDYAQIEEDMQTIIDERFLPGLVLSVAAEFSPG